MTVTPLLDLELSRSPVVSNKGELPRAPNFSVYSGL